MVPVEDADEADDAEEESSSCCCCSSVSKRSAAAAAAAPPPPSSSSSASSNIGGGIAGSPASLALAKARWRSLIVGRCLELLKRTNGSG